MRSALMLLLVVAVTACGERSPLAPDGFTHAPCRPPPALLAMVNGQPFAPAAMRTALLHSAGPMVAALDATADVRAMQNAIRRAVNNITASNYDGACRMLTIADGLLSEIPATPATLPDRDGIRLIFALTAQSLGEVMPR